ncbi:MAG: OmpA family protein [Geminicoccaceae bacterium]
MRFLGIVICLITLMLAGYSAITHKAPEIETDIQERVDAAIAETTSVPIDVVVDGRMITLRGVVNHDHERLRLLAVAHSIRGGARLRDGLELVAVTAPYRFEATKSESGAVIIDGFAPDHEARQLLLSDSHAVFGEDAEVEINVAAGAPTGDWRSAINIGMDALTTMADGRLSIIDQAITLEGTVETTADSKAIDLFAAAAPEGFTWTNNLSVLRLVVTPYTLSVQKSADGVLTIKGHAPDEATRNTIIEQAKAAAGDRPVVANILIADGMPDANWPDLVGTSIAAMAQVEHGMFEASDNDVSFSGDVAPNDDVVRGEKASEGVPGPSNRLADAAGEQAGDAVSETKPYVLTVDKSDLGDWSLHGMVPDAEVRDRLVAFVAKMAGDAKVDTALQLADGKSADEWAPFVSDHLIALDMVKSGRLTFADHQVHLIGVVDTPEDIAAVERDLAIIDSAMTADLNPIDPRSAAKLDLKISPDDGVTLSGTLPEGLVEGEAAAALGLKGYNGRLEEGARGDLQAWRKSLTAIGSYLPQFERLGLTLLSDKAVIEGELHGRGDVDQVVEGLNKALGEDQAPAIDIALSDRSYANGTRRVNPLTGREEEYDRGFWLPVIAFTADVEECREHSSTILDSHKINFVRGEAALDARAEQVIDDLAAVAINCLGGGELVLEIGGHTDSRGAKSMNDQLSQDRADLVLQSLIARGVAATSLIAKGHGDTKPIADNATNEGRAQNRRITFEWKKSWIDG